MLRFILRSLGFVLLAAAFAAVIVDGTRSIAAAHILLYSFGDTAAWLFPAKLVTLRDAFDHGAMRSFAPVWLGLMSVPTWIVSATVGLLLLFAGRRPPPKIGFSSRP